MQAKAQVGHVSDQVHQHLQHASSTLLGVLQAASRQPDFPYQVDTCGVSGMLTTNSCLLPLFSHYFAFFA